MTYGTWNLDRYTFLVREDPLDVRKAKAILEADPKRAGWLPEWSWIQENVTGQ